MAKGMKCLAGRSGAATALSFVFYCVWPLGWLFSLAVTWATLAYHLCMRLLVGGVYQLAFCNRVDYTRAWFRVGEREQGLYRALRVKGWKKHLPTYDPAAFDPKRHSWEEIAGAMAQAELVHETIAGFSFLPLLAIPWLGAGWVFVLTSLASALLDLSFAALQRYNRPRVLRLIRN